MYLMLVLIPLLALNAVFATPVRRSTSVTPLTADQESSYTPAVMFASTAYCPSSQTATWTCGASCNAIFNFMPFGAGGDGDETQFWYVGYDSAFFNAIVVAHQGTDPDDLLPLLTDGEFFLESLSTTLFPGISESIKAHNGFQHAHSRTALAVLAAVQDAMQTTGSTKVVLTGHSLGAAIALLDAIYLPLHLPPSTTFTTTVLGLPRVGNAAFASYVDAHVTSFTHITNKHDPIPIVPGRFLGFAHPSNEVHIKTTGLAAGNWYACDGQDNTSSDCSTGAVPNIFEGHAADHTGPYGNISMGC